ncbi:NADH-quinone oxidoreductase subunit J [Nocardioides sp. Bht2]|uniref:NADH-quinone oxidoreductase subunit J n=1 Tax=Nocardioides sp. Bht2 TaxID=3392297 RepID=UPI0039B51025
MTAFWILAPIMVIAALGILFVRKAVHAALLLAVVMVSLAVLYAVLEAPFLFAVQIIVYTGAILMLFLFVLMLVGVDASDSVVETIRGQRLLATIVGLAFGATLILSLSQLTFGTVVGLDEANNGGNVEALANLLFSNYVFAFETTSALLITAAMGAMLLAHRERITAKLGQREHANQRMTEYAETGRHPGPLPAPGVFARHNAVDTPALLPDGSPSYASISRVLAARGAVRSAPVEQINEVLRQLGAPAVGPAPSTLTPEARDEENVVLADDAAAAPPAQAPSDLPEGPSSEGPPAEGKEDA